jgi:hypothetical protein
VLRSFFLPFKIKDAQHRIPRDLTACAPGPAGRWHSAIDAAADGNLGDTAVPFVLYRYPLGFPGDSPSPASITDDDHPILPARIKYLRYAHAPYVRSAAADRTDCTD